jgi:hypothetical protein
MVRTVMSKESFIPIKRFGYKGYILYFDCADIDDTLNNVVCSEDTITVEDNTKNGLIKAIVEYKYSPKDVNIILSSTYNGETSEHIVYLEWLDYAKKCASIIFDAPTLENAIKAKLEEITKYDISSAVNGFYYQGSEYWLDKDTRVGLMNSTTILKEAGETSTSLWLGNLHIVLPVDDVIDKLSQLEVYALECYNVTAQHKVAVSRLQTIEEVKAYDITSGYPTKLDLT